MSARLCLGPEYAQQGTHAIILSHILPKSHICLRSDEENGDDNDGNTDMMMGDVRQGSDRSVSRHSGCTVCPCAR